MTTLITFASLKGGVGKTTHAVALAAGLLDMGKTVRFLETDEQGSAGAWADDVAQAHENLDSVYISLKANDFAEAQDAIAENAEGPDFTIVDTAGNANAATLASMYLADLVLVPFALREWDLDGLDRLHATYKQMFERFEEDNPETMVALYRRGVSFISKHDQEKLQGLSQEYVVRAGLLDTPSIPKWISNNRTPAQLREGLAPVVGSDPLNDKTLQKADGHIKAFTSTILEMFNA
ncbi:hypothetical protein GCM10007385_46430 [Tateyamaria omphalii]|uniref:ParA family protein n=1 Tax=Tateyamaria omphalii TaxID=299262 RepID=UPI0016784B4E|nr:ParA family protein [Tateyamaria omphalii]GGX72380.1 hypothetical protein GCM10007385_46430 [Tateyamaria omphalii]